MTKLLKNRRAAVSMNTIIMLAVGFFLAAILIPIALNQIFVTSTSGWNTAVITIFTILVPVIFIIAIAISYIPRGKKGTMMPLPMLLAKLVEKLKKLVKDEHGGLTMENIILMVVGFFVFAILAPIGLTQIYAVPAGNQTAWGTTIWTIFSVLLPILFLVGVAVRYIPRGKGG